MVTWISVAISLLALFVSIWTWKFTYLLRRYETADNLLLELHKIELNHPDFRDPEWCKQAIDHTDKSIRNTYDIFACTVWNFLETLYDRYGEKNLRKSPFFSVMKDLARRHSAWFFKEENFSCFNPQLAKFLHVEKYESRGI